MKEIDNLRNELEKVFINYFKSLKLTLKEEEIWIFLDTYNQNKFDRNMANNIFNKISDRNKILNPKNFIYYYLKIYFIWIFTIKVIEIDIGNKTDKINGLNKMEKNLNIILKLNIFKIEFKKKKDADNQIIKNKLKNTIFECNFCNNKDYFSSNLIYKNKEFKDNNILNIEDDIIVYYQNETSLEKNNFKIIIKDIFTSEIISCLDFKLVEDDSLTKTLFLEDINCELILYFKISKIKEIGVINNEHNDLTNNIHLNFSKKENYEKVLKESIHPFKSIFKRFKLKNILFGNESPDTSLLKEVSDLKKNKSIPFTVKLSLFLTITVFIFSLLSSGDRVNFMDDFVCLSFLGNFIIWRQFNTILSYKLILSLVLSLIYDLVWLFIEIPHMRNSLVNGNQLKYYKIWCDWWVILNFILKSLLIIIYFKLGKEGIDYKLIDDKEDMDVSFHGVPIRDYLIKN